MNTNLNQSETQGTFNAFIWQLWQTHNRPTSACLGCVWKKRNGCD
jgi:hypothetical protein